MWPQYGGVRVVGPMRVVHWNSNQQHSAVANSAREGGREGRREGVREGERVRGRQMREGENIQKEC